MLANHLYAAHMLTFAATPRLAPTRLRPARLLQEPPDPSEPDDPFDGDPFDAGVSFGKNVSSRFFAPAIDDPGLPLADSLVVISGSLFIAYVVLAVGLPRPSWLVPMAGMPNVRALPFVLPTLAHGSALSVCWLLGGLAAQAFESGAYMGSWREALSRTVKGGAFSTGLLILGTQTVLNARLDAMGLDPYVAGGSYAADLVIAGTANELIVDTAVSAVGLIGFRLFRWWDAQAYK